MPELAWTLVACARRVLRRRDELHRRRRHAAHLPRAHRGVISAAIANGTSTVALLPGSIAGAVGLPQGAVGVPAVRAADDRAEPRRRLPRRVARRLRPGGVRDARAVAHPHGGGAVRRAGPALGVGEARAAADGRATPEHHEAGLDHAGAGDRAFSSWSRCTAATSARGSAF